VRALIEAQLRRHAANPASAPTAFDHVVGPVSPAMRAQLERPDLQAAVLVGLVERPSGISLLLTERARHLKNHAGQVAFPGGRAEPGDAGPVATALREAHEEIGLEPSVVEVVATIDPQITGTGFRVTPVVGFVGSAFEPVPDPGEVAEVFEMPLQFALDEANLVRREWERSGTRFRGYEYVYAGHRVWGATAAMIIRLRKIILTTIS
jgi:8-oxo-dGTP pyrophosphatase MutT (NUDIX family)